MLGNEGGQQRIESTEPDRKLRVKVGLDERCLRRDSLGDTKHATREIEADRSAAGGAEPSEVRAGPASRIEHPLAWSCVEHPKCMATVERDDWIGGRIVGIGPVIVSLADTRTRYSLANIVAPPSM